jgi:hypothetical protein
VLIYIVVFYQQTPAGLYFNIVIVIIIIKINILSLKKQKINLFIALAKYLLFMKKDNYVILVVT